MRADPDNYGDDPVQKVYVSDHERRMLELERELEIARKQAELERTRAEAVARHLAAENQELRRQPAGPIYRPVARPRANPVWLLAGHIIGRLGSLVLGLFSCLSCVLLILLIWAYWPEISALIN